MEISIRVAPSVFTAVLLIGLFTRRTLSQGKFISLTKFLAFLLMDYYVNTYSHTGPQVDMKKQSYFPSEMWRIKYSVRFYQKEQVRIHTFF